MSRLGESIKQAREQQGLSLKQVAKKTGLSEKYLEDVESGGRIPTEDAANRVLKFLGKYESTTTAFYDGDVDKAMAAEPPQPVRRAPAPPKPVEKAPAEPNDAWLDALSGVVKNIPVYDSRGQKVDGRLLAVEQGRIFGAQPDKLRYFRASDDSMRGDRIRRGDLVLVSVTGSVQEGALMLVSVDGQHMVRKPHILRDGRLRLIAQDGHTDHDAVDVQVLGRCIRLEVAFS